MSEIDELEELVNLIEELYWNDNYSIKEISIKISLSEESIRLLMVKYEIDRRSLEDIKKDPNYWKKVSNSLLKKWNEKEYKEKMKQIQKDKWTPELRKKHSDIFKEKWKDPEYRKKVINSLKEIRKNKEHREKISIARKKIWDDPNYKERVSKNIKKAIDEKFKTDKEYKEKVSKSVTERNKRYLGKNQIEILKVLDDTSEVIKLMQTDNKNILTSLNTLSKRNIVKRKKVHKPEAKSVKKYMFGYKLTYLGKVLLNNYIEKVEKKDIENMYEDLMFIIENIQLYYWL
jgi:hypothetical protein